MAALKDHMHLNLLSMSSENKESSEPGQVEKKDGGGECVVEMKHFMAAIEKLRPSVSKKASVCVCVMQ